MNSLTKILDINLQSQIDTLVHTTGKPEKIVLREVIKAGIRNYPAEPTKSRNALLNLAKWAEENNIAGPADLSTNHNKYAWDRSI